MKQSFHIPLPAVDFAPPRYVCPRAVKPFVLDGRLDKDFWADVPFTDDFLDIEGDHMPTPRFRTRVKMQWDDENLYIGAVLEGNEIWAHQTERDCVIFQDNDFEIFIDPDSDTHVYIEFEMNARNTVWDLLLSKPYRDNGKAINGYDIHGLQTAVHIDGKLNEVNSENQRWSVEVVIPFAEIGSCSYGNASPKDGDFYRVNFSRVQWKADEKDGAWAKRINPETNAPYPEDNWVWAPTGVINIHYPELWGYVFFSDGSRDSSSYQIPEDEKIKWELRKLYYAQQMHWDIHGCFTDSLDTLKDLLAAHSPKHAHTVSPADYTIAASAHQFEISCSNQAGDGVISIFADGKVCSYK